MPGFGLLIQVSFLLISAVALVISALVVINIYSAKRVSKLTRELASQKAYSADLKHELIDVKMKAEESDILKSSFLANMSHEIRTPLNAIMGFSSLLQQVDSIDDDYKQYVDIIHRNSNKLIDMMDEVFNIALIEAGSTTMYKEKCSVSELLTSLVAFFNVEKDQLGKHDVNIRIRKATHYNSFSVFTDPRKLRQTLFNLVENAIKYTHEGYIEIGYDLKDNSIIQFYVKDTGDGFPQEKLDIIFQRFRQIDDSNTRSYGGIGLGLTISQKFVEMMGGEMWGESTPGKGSTFYFTLPYEAIDEDKLPQAKTEGMEK